MPILEDLLSKGYIDTQSNEVNFNYSKIKCPFCSTEYNLDDGIYNCTNCKNTFRKIGFNTYDEKKVSNAAADYLVQLLTYCAKVDKSISCEERDFIVEYIESFDINEDQESWLFAQYDYARFNDYNKNVILFLKKSINQLCDNFNLEFDILSDILSVFFIDNDTLNSNQEEIIKDYLSIFEIPTKIYKEKFNEFLKHKLDNDKVNKNHKHPLDEYYEILGLERRCSIQDLKRQYAYLCKTYHPDKYNSQNVPYKIKKEMEEMYKKINNAYDKLKNNF